MPIELLQGSRHGARTVTSVSLLTYLETNQRVGLQNKRRLGGQAQRGKSHGTTTPIHPGLVGRPPKHRFPWATSIHLLLRNAHSLPGLEESLSQTTRRDALGGISTSSPQKLNFLQHVAF